MKKFLKKMFKIILGTALVLILTIVGLDIWHSQFSTPSGEGRWKSESPDGRFIVTGYSTKSLFVMLIPTAPGDGGFGPGIVILRDKKTGEVLQQARVENLGGMDEESVKWMIGDPDAVWRKNYAARAGLKEPWGGDYVYVKLLTSDEWPLPSVDGKMPPPLP